MEGPSKPVVEFRPRGRLGRLPESEFDSVLGDRDGFDVRKQHAEGAPPCPPEDLLDGRADQFGWPKEGGRAGTRLGPGGRSEEQLESFVGRRYPGQGWKRLGTRVRDGVEQVRRGPTEGCAAEGRPLAGGMGLLELIQALQESSPPSTAHATPTGERLEPPDAFINSEVGCVDEGV